MSSDTRRAKASLAKDLIPAVDNLERALETAPDDDPLSDGVRLVHRELSDALGLLFQHVERRQASGRHRRRMRRGK